MNIQRFVRVNRRFLIILGLALIRGMLYVSALPPWGLNDEQQHFHYIQSICEGGYIPIVGKDYISPEIALSSYQTKRREVFHWPSYPSSHPQDWGLEGYSYEGYQPPLYYIVLAPIYKWTALISSNILVKLQVLKWASVCLSLITLYLLYHLVVLLFPRQQFAPFLVCSLIVWWPERTMSTSRVNNDVLVEVLGATLYVLLVKNALKKSVSKRDSLLIGIVFGLGLLTKMTFLPWAVGIFYVFWLHRKDGWLGLLIATWISVIMATPYAIRNFLIYGDPTGFSGFQKLAGLVSAPDKTPFGVVKSVGEFLMYLWVVWWKGARAGGSLLVRIIFYIYFSLFYLLLGCGLARFFLRYKQTEKSTRILLILNFVVIGAFSLSVIGSYYAGRIPLLQGRFMLPVALPLLVLITNSLLQLKQGDKILVVLSFSFAVIDLAQLFVNLLPFFYYWSAFNEKNSINNTWRIFIERFLADKPEGWQWLVIGFIIIYASLSFMWIRELRRNYYA